MAKTVKLSEVFGAYEMAGDEIKNYLDTETMKAVFVTDDMLSEVEEGDEAELEGEYGKEALSLAKAILAGKEDGRYLELPDAFEIHAWSIMESFVLSLEDGRQKDDLDRAIHGKGAFRMFKDTCYRLGIQDDWYAFERETYKERAKEWCEAHELAYEDDVVVKRKKG